MKNTILTAVVTAFVTSVLTLGLVVAIKGNKHHKEVEYRIEKHIDHEGRVENEFHHKRKYRRGCGEEKSFCKSYSQEEKGRQCHKQKRFRKHGHHGAWKQEKMMKGRAEFEAVLSEEDKATIQALRDQLKDVDRREVHRNPEAFLEKYKKEVLALEKLMVKYEKQLKEIKEKHMDTKKMEQRKRMMKLHFMLMPDKK